MTNSNNGATWLPFFASCWWVTEYPAGNTGWLWCSWWPCLALWASTKRISIKAVYLSSLSVLPPPNNFKKERLQTPIDQLGCKTAFSPSSSPYPIKSYNHLTPILLSLPLSFFRLPLAVCANKHTFNCRRSGSCLLCLLFLPLASEIHQWFVCLLWGVLPPSSACRIQLLWLPMETEDHWLSRKLQDFSGRMGLLRHLASWTEWLLLLSLSSAQITTGELPRTYHIRQPHNSPFNMYLFFAFCSSSEPWQRYPLSVLGAKKFLILIPMP